MSTVEKGLKVIAAIGGITAMGIAVVFPHRGYYSFTIMWVIFVVAFARRRSLFPDFNTQSRDMQDFGTFIGWFVIAVLGAGIASMWLLDSWHF